MFRACWFNKQSVEPTDLSCTSVIFCFDNHVYCSSHPRSQFEPFCSSRGISGCSEYAESFVSHEIDGYALMLVKEEHLVVGLKMKLGPALKLVGRVNQMKAEALETNMHNAASVANTPRQKSVQFTTRAEPQGKVQNRPNGVA